MRKPEQIIPPRETDLGGLVVRRLLPYASRRMIGPFIFFDHMGPAEFGPGQGISVRPHPHIHLATVTYLFEGKIHHRDSLGSDQFIEPGAINWMVAGRGIVHSERAPSDLLASGSRLDGIQCWIALPEEAENDPPTFVHHSAASMPEFAIGDGRARLLLGSAFGHTSPVAVHSDLFYLHLELPAGCRFVLPEDGRENALYLARGGVRIAGEELPLGSLAVGVAGSEVEAISPARLMLLGGASLGRRHIYWNFVSSSLKSIEAAKADWREGPGNTARFPKVPGDELEFIPLPRETRPPGTVM